MSNSYKRHQAENRKDIEKKIEDDIKEMNPQQRFGFFSIPYNATIGDEFYSRDAEYHHTIVEGKVIGEKRGIFGQPGKSGKGKDAYFKCMDYAEDSEINLLKNKAIQDKRDMLNTVRERKEKKFVPPFKSAGGQEYKDLLDQAPVQYNKPVTAVPPRKFQVVEGKVITEPRGVFTNPPKKGFNNIPGILFSPIPAWVEPQGGATARRCVSCKPRMEKTEYVKPFFPASLKKNECFVGIRDTFGLPDDTIKPMLEESMKNRRKGYSKYQKRLPPGSAKHLNPFSPASMSKQGREGLFHKDIWHWPGVPEERVIVNQRERKELEAKNRKDPFKYNKIQKYSTFSPSVVGNTLNMKRDFPSVFKH